MSCHDGREDRQDCSGLGFTILLSVLGLALLAAGLGCKQEPEPVSRRPTAADAASNPPGGGAPDSGLPAPTPAPTPTPDAAQAADMSRPADSGGGAIDAASPSAGCREIVTAANAFIAGLGQDMVKRTAALRPFTERRHFRFTPGGQRPGLRMRDMTPAQRSQALVVLQRALSQTGFQKAELIRKFEVWLTEEIGDDIGFDELGYYLAIYGTPSVDGSWAWHWEGHHLSLHFTFVGCVGLASAPAMFGAEPARLPNAFPGGPPVGTRVLEREEDLARALAMSFNADPQKRQRAIANTGARMVPNTPDPATPLTPAGLPLSAMSPAEAERLKELIAVYAANLTPDLASFRLQRLQEAGMENISFLWVGSFNQDQPYYYRIQGPTFLIEFNLEDDNHIHSVWRDFNGDFGEDLLQRHLLQHPHRSAALLSK
jgi:hypothetical protein